MLHDTGQRIACCDSCQLIVTSMPKIKDVLMVIGATLLVFKVLAYRRTYVRRVSHFSDRWVSKFSKVWGSARMSSARSISANGELKQSTTTTGRERHEIKGLIRKTIAVHVRYKSLYSSLPSSAKQQHEMTKFCVVYGTWTSTATFSYFHLELNAVV